MGTYPFLASTMANNPALQVFRRFSDLNLKSLLYYQAELARLQEDLEKAEEDDATSGDLPRKIYGINWGALASDVGSGSIHTQSPTSSNAQSQADVATSQTSAYQWKIMCRLRVALEAYCTCTSINTSVRKAKGSEHIHLCRSSIRTASRDRPPSS